MSLVHKTKKKDGKKHKTKKKTQKKQQIFKIKLRKDRFRMFGPHLKSISTVPAWFKVNFGLFQLPVDMIWFSRYSLILAELVQFSGNWPELARICKKKKKKKLTHGCGAHFSASMHHSLGLGRCKLCNHFSGNVKC